jgi:hypothetical protein
MQASTMTPPGPSYDAQPIPKRHCLFLFPYAECQLQELTHSHRLLSNIAKGLTPGQPGSLYCAQYETMLLRVIENLLDGNPELEDRLCLSFRFSDFISNESFKICLSDFLDEPGLFVWGRTNHDQPDKAHELGFRLPVLRLDLCYAYDRAVSSFSS